MNIKLTNPVHVDLFKFVVHGEFDYIKMGQTKEWILNNFPDPDTMSNMNHDLYIWQYGNIEFHFHHDVLYMIWCDNFYRFTAGKHIHLNKWIFEKTRYLTLSKTMKVLNEHKISFTLVHNKNLKNAIIRILKSNVELWFEPNDDEDYKNPDANTFHFMAFGLTHEDYRRQAPST
ncbi:hypothetical protein NLX71_10730 [Paenibacillus sp. MZ04-78.2]|uniref:hypothetical protein n=1 Tax=Paenibacillus sp. MZ04-78.2 TaxID=2962034 RepID=UPI0020B6E467|nr:hypothetical protein [Paenibacillus sp. MZ04-78.2]MCP3773784.1 hypothetical protein [Paenibacillus sp. MZ04-78.2]